MVCDQDPTRAISNMAVWTLSLAAGARQDRQRGLERVETCESSRRKVTFLCCYFLHRFNLDQASFRFRTINSSQSWGPSHKVGA